MTRHNIALLTFTCAYDYASITSGMNLSTANRAEPRVDAYACAIPNVKTYMHASHNAVLVQALIYTNLLVHVHVHVHANPSILFRWT